MLSLPPHAHRVPVEKPDICREAGWTVGLLGLAVALATACGSSSPLAADEGVKPGVRIEISPSSVEIEPSQSVQFEAVMINSHGDEQDFPDAAMKWSATGGTICSTGRYVAGTRAGEFKVTARKGSVSGYATVKIQLPAGNDGSGGDAGDNQSGSGDNPTPLEGVRIEVGESIQSYVDSNPAGTTFVLAAGRHMKQSVAPKDGDEFVGEAGAVLDGGGVVEHAFRSKASKVTIRDLVIEKYAPAPSDGVIHAVDADGWVVEDTEIRYNVASVQHPGCASSSGCGGMGIKMGDRMVVRDNYLHHNDQYGVGGSGLNLLVEGNEIAFNNYRDAVRTGWGAGGTKFVKTSGLVVRGNYVHDNHGNGLWTDIDNVGTLVEKNRVENNYRQGIFHEISHAAVIRNNTVRGNGLKAGGDWLYGAGILVAHSDNVEVYGNVVEGNSNGIVGIQQNRDNPPGSHRLRNLWVHDNTIELGSGSAGVGKRGFAVYDPFTSSANNRFDDNEYRLRSPDSRSFRWAGRKLTLAEWQALGHD